VIPGLAGSVPQIPDEEPLITHRPRNHHTRPEKTLCDDRFALDLRVAGGPIPGKTRMILAVRP
jgi:hypothetical protein